MSFEALNQNALITTSSKLAILLSMSYYSAIKAAKGLWGRAKFHNTIPCNAGECLFTSINLLALENSICSFT